MTNIDLSVMASTRDGEQSWFPKRCNGSATARSGCRTSRRITVGQRLHRIVQQPSQDGVPGPQPLEESCGPSSATSSTSTTNGTDTRPWATEPQLSTLRRAGTPTPRSPARSTESGTKQPASLNPGGLTIGDSHRSADAIWQAAEFLWGSTSSTRTSELVLEQTSIDSCDRHGVRAESLGYVRGHEELLPSRRL
jgi:hypothetical protein